LLRITGNSGLQAKGRRNPSDVPVANPVARNGLLSQRLGVPIVQRGKKTLRFFIATGSEKPKCCYRSHPLAGQATRLSRERVGPIRNPWLGE
jgi:hypothetical protein